MERIGVNNTESPAESVVPTTEANWASTPEVSPSPVDTFIQQNDVEATLAPTITGDHEQQEQDSAQSTVEPTATVEIPQETNAIVVTPTYTPEPKNSPFMDELLFPLLFAIIAVCMLLVTILTLVYKKKALKATPQKPLPIKQEKGTFARGTVSAGGCQYIGTREHQEDSFGISDVNDPQLCSKKGILAVVADGIGGMDDGQIASKLVVQTLASEFYQEADLPSPALRLLTLAANAHIKVSEYRQQHGTRCGSTLVAVLLDRNDLYFISVGDSRIMLYRQGGLIQLNREHKLGKVLEERAALNDLDGSTANRKPAVLTSHIGMDDLRQIDRNTSPIHLLSGDKVLLMSDGVYGTLSEGELLSLLGNNPEESAAHICEAVKAKQRRSQDNATVVVLNIW